MSLQTAPAPKRQEQLDFYAQPTALTELGRHASLVRELPNDVSLLVRLVQGLVIHRYMAPAYGVTIRRERAGDDHIRAVASMLDRVLASDSKPLTEARPPEERLVGVCRHFAVLLVALLRAKGTPARARCGAGSYFNPGYFEDHWVCEYWKADENRWALADPQFDELWQRNLEIDHDVLDVPLDRLLVAGDAWARCRSGEADPAKFGIIAGNLRGLWFVAGELVRDIAALNKQEMLAWDVWGAMFRQDEKPTSEQLALFDRLAEISREPDAKFEDLRQLYESDERVRVPGTVFNAVLNRPEAV
jgi:Transglutaminase-like superfamily